MASTSYTPNLGLNQWQPTDRPKRIDFVNDNKVIDQKLGEHLVNVGVHVTPEEKAVYSSPYKVVNYVGDGNSTQVINIEQGYSFAIIFQKYYPPVEFVGSDAVVHFAIVGRTIGSSSNMTMNASSVTVTQDAQATDNVINNFNEAQGQYVMLLFR